MNQNNNSDVTYTSGTFYTITGGLIGMINGVIMFVVKLGLTEQAVYSTIFLAALGATVGFFIGEFCKYLKRRFFKIDLIKGKLHVNTK